MSIAKIAGERLVDFDVIGDTMTEPAPGEISIQLGHVVEITAVDLTTPRGTDPVYKGQLFDLATREPLDSRPTPLRSREAARVWWESVAPGIPVCEELLEVV